MHKDKIIEIAAFLESNEEVDEKALLLQNIVKTVYSISTPESFSLHGEYKIICTGYQSNGSITSDLLHISGSK